MTTTIARVKSSSGVPIWALVTSQGLTPIRGDYQSTGQLLTQGRGDIDAARKAPVDVGLQDARVVSPITRDQRLVCQFGNYRSHLLEIGIDPPESAANTVFTKAPSSICGPTDNIVYPPQVRLLDYEIEIGLVIGSPITAQVKISKEALGRYCAGLVMLNDVSARDVQLIEGQYHKGKSFRTFAPIGPYLVLLDDEEWSLFDQLQLRLKVDGVLRQKETAADMVYKPEATLTELSGVFDMLPGDVIATGTPAGVALSAPPRLVQRLMQLVPEAPRWRAFVRRQLKNDRYLRPGQTITASIRTSDGRIDLGQQCNSIVKHEAHL
jgi:2,4-diketo-3-deoxy-L-fuconate hydrolase